MNCDARALKEALENLNAKKSTSRILTSILLQYSENFELKPKCKL